MIRQEKSPFICLTSVFLSLFLNFLPMTLAGLSDENLSKMKIIEKYLPSLLKDEVLFRNLPDIETQIVMRPFYLIQYYRYNLAGVMVPADDLNSLGVLSSKEISHYRKLNKIPYQYIQKIINRSSIEFEDYVASLLLIDSNASYLNQKNIHLAEKYSEFSQFISLRLIKFFQESKNISENSKSDIVKHFTAVLNEGLPESELIHLKGEMDNLLKNHKKYAYLIRNRFFNQMNSFFGIYEFNHLLLKILGSEYFIRSKVLKLDLENIHFSWAKVILQSFKESGSLQVFDFFRSKIFQEGLKRQVVQPKDIILMLNQEEFWKVLQKRQDKNLIKVMNTTFIYNYYLRNIFKYLWKLHISEGEWSSITSSRKEKFLLLAFKEASLEDFPLLTELLLTNDRALNSEEIKILLRDAVPTILQRLSNYMNESGDINRKSSYYAEISQEITKIFEFVQKNKIYFLGMNEALERILNHPGMHWSTGLQENYLLKALNNLQEKSRGLSVKGPLALYVDHEPHIGALTVVSDSGGLQLVDQSKESEVLELVGQDSKVATSSGLKKKKRSASEEIKRDLILCIRFNLRELSELTKSFKKSK